MNARSLAVRATARAPVAKRKASQTPNLGDMVTALLDRPEVTTEMLDRAERLLNLHRQQVYATAMVACQEEMPVVFKNKKGDKARYATFEQLDRAARPVYIRHGFSLSFGTEPPVEGPERVRVTVDIIHVSGMIKREALEMPADGKGAKGNDVLSKPHATLSAVSYAKRTLEAMIFNIVTSEDAQFDDDGQAAGGSVGLSEEDARTIRAMLEAAGITQEKFLKWAKVDRVEDIRSQDYDLVVAEIARVAKEKKAKTDA